MEINIALSWMIKSKSRMAGRYKERICHAISTRKSAPIAQVKKNRSETIAKEPEG
jgi:hypothetical protein